ncbi:MAG: hypothetical protein HY648_02455 [Acidobacteria bacterium]|nr:hypothetical protein [Acidobacteriota bacterium]
MNCEEFERGWQDLEDFTDASPLMERHRQECPACAEMVRELQSIIQQARQMLPLENPPERIWLEVRQQLEKERLIPRAPQSRFPVSVPIVGWFQRVPLGLAYAAVFSLALGAVYLHNVFTNASAPSPAVSASQQAVAMTQATSRVQDEAFQELVGKIPHEKRAVYTTQFERVNSSIQQLSTFVHEHPDDPFVREQLVNAIGQRERLWETMVRWEEF